MNDKIGNIMLAYIIELAINVSVLRDKIIEVLETFSVLFDDYYTF